MVGASDYRTVGGYVPQVPATLCSIGMRDDMTWQSAHSTGRLPDDDARPMERV